MITASRGTPGRGGRRTHTQGSVAVSLCITTQSRYTIFSKRVGASVSKKTLRPNPTRTARGRCRPHGPLAPSGSASRQARAAPPGCCPSPPSTARNASPSPAWHTDVVVRRQSAGVATRLLPPLQSAVVATRPHFGGARATLLCGADTGSARSQSMRGRTACFWLQTCSSESVVICCSKSFWSISEDGIRVTCRVRAFRAADDHGLAAARSGPSTLLSVLPERGHPGC